LHNAIDRYLGDEASNKMVQEADKQYDK